MKKISILFFGKIPPPFIGPAVATKIIINSELKNKFNLIFFDISHHKSIDDLGKYKWSNFVSAFKRYYYFIKLLKSKNPDIVYIPSQQTTIAYLRDIPFFIITKLYKKKLVCHLRGGYFRNWYEKELSSIMKWIVRKTQQNIDAQIVLGENLKYLFDFIMPKEKIFVVPNAADYNFPVIVKSDKKIKVLFLGNFIKSKGVIDVLKTAVILKKHRDIEFVFAGNWREQTTKDEFKKIVQDNNDININVVGKIHGKDKFKLLASCDIFVFPSYYRNEGHPWVIVEAMAAGLPVISTDHGAIIESVINDKNGFIVPPKSPKKIAEKILFFIKNENERKKYGELSKKFHAEKFSEKNIVENLSKVFNTIIKK